RTRAAALGGGALVSVGRFDRAELAVVLEPDDALASAWRALYAGMVALSDALAALAPPGKSITVAWPDAIRVDGRLVGGGRLAQPGGIDDADAPPWLVFGAMIRTVSTTDGAGLRPPATALEDEGFADAGADRLVEGFARHLMRVTNHWRDAGFGPIASEYASRLERRDEDIRYAIGDDGDLLVTRSGRPVERRPLRPQLAAPSWLDPACGGPG
ncbi:MAG: biotin/lipoate--protein ligase family protein, partial [Xanthobacteraceae bacterium]